MKNPAMLSKQTKGKRGAVAVYVAILLVVFIGFTALAIDVGYMMVTRNELQNVADASALAAARKLGMIYKAMTPNQQNDYKLTGDDLSAIRKVAIDVAKANKAGGTQINLIPTEILVGTWNPKRTNPGPFLTVEIGSDDAPDAVEVTARRDGTANNKLVMFFAGIFGADTAQVGITATATAALTGPPSVPEGGLVLPIGIPTAWFDEDFCPDNIAFKPTDDPEGCAGWHTYKEKTASAETLEEIMQRYLPLEYRNKKYDDLSKYPMYLSPETIFGETEYRFTGGTNASVFEPFYYLWDYFRSRDLPDTRDDTWVANIVVYDYPDCSNPNKKIVVVGLTEVEITAVEGPSDKTIVAKVNCNSFKDMRGSGTNYGVKGTIPGLVK